MLNRMEIIYFIGLCLFGLYEIERSMDGYNNVYAILLIPSAYILAKVIARLRMENAKQFKSDFKTPKERFQFYSLVWFVILVGLIYYFFFKQR